MAEAPSIVTPTTSLVSDQEAAAYFAGRLYADAWDNADATTRQKALVTATRDLDAETYQGAQADPAQPHAFPRAYTAPPVMDAGTFYHPSGFYQESAIPSAIKAAACEQALHLLTQTPYERDRQRHMAAGVSGIGIGGASEQFTESATNLARRGDRLGPEARRLAGPYLALVVDLG